MSKKYIFVYKTINLLSGKYYIGVHTTDDLEDGYLGSGGLLKRAIKKHGKENFKREILSFFDTEEEAFKHEFSLITPELTKDENCYNVALGGTGGYTISGYSQEEKFKHERKRVAAFKKSGANQGERNFMYGKKLKDVYSPETYEAWKVKNIENKKGEKNGMYGTPPWLSPASTDKSLALWSNADKLYELWIANPVKSYTLAKLNNDEDNITYQNITKKFFSGWNPQNDSKWLQFKRKKEDKIPIFFTSDLHLFHENVIKYSNRPFKNCEEMHESLIKRWNATVPSYGIIYVLGDVGFAKGDLIKSVLNRMNGTKILILGNHDGSIGKMYDSGFTVVLNSTTLYLGNSRLELNHCPPRGVFREDVTGMRGAKSGENWHGEHRHYRFSKDYNENAFWLHGHTHKKPKERTLGRMFDVGIDANNYAPVSMGTIESWIALYLKNNPKD